MNKHASCIPPEPDTSGPAGIRAVNVAVDLPVWKTFSYRMPDGLAPDMVLGRRVRVPFGKRTANGYAVGITIECEIEGLKDIAAILDAEPLFPMSMVSLFDWVSKFYLCPPGQVLSALLPPGLSPSTHRIARLTEKGKAILESKTKPSNEMEMLEWVGKNPGKKIPWPAPKATSLKSRGLIEIETAHLRKSGAGPLMKSFLRMKDPADLTDIFKTLGPKQLSKRGMDLIRLIYDAGSAPSSDLRRKFGDYLINKWVNKGVLERFEAPFYRRPITGIVRDYPRPEFLFPQQEKSIEGIESLIVRDEFACCMLYGVTGSGKTEIYCRAAEAAIKRGKQVLIMVPEISLATYMEGIFSARIGERTAVYHSGLSEGERYDQWMRISRGEVDLVLGARSALFSPLGRIGLIIVDEEHDPAYKQDSSPRYQGRDTAVMRGKLENAVVILGSGTPSVQSYQNALTGKYSLISMPERVENRPIPQVLLVDMKKIEEGEKDPPLLSPTLLEAMEDNLKKGDQTLLFLNRRGYHRLFLCRACGEILKCPNCDVALTYHLNSRHLICHYCGYSTGGTGRCSACGCEAFKAYGFGTEKLEEEIEARFPGSRTARMDADTTRRRGEALRLLKKFSAGEIDILIGTQMITKGFDFPAVTLVGVVASDLSLGFPDFRAAERTFQLLSQVAGRAGRGEKPGRVIVQTFNPSHYALAAAVGNDYNTFLQKEISLRSSLGYPPFRYMAILRLQGNKKKDTAEIATEISHLIRRYSAGPKSERGELRVLGPVEAPLSKLKGKYRFQIMIKAAHPFIIQSLLKRLIASQKASLNRKGVECTVDMDPYQML